MSAAAEIDIWPLPIKSANFDTVFDSVKSSSRLRFLTARENIWEHLKIQRCPYEKEFEIKFKTFRPSVSKMLAPLCIQPIAGLALQTHCCRSLSLSVLWEGYILSICRGINMPWSGHERHRNSEIKMTNPYVVEWSWKTSKLWDKDDEPLCCGVVMKKIKFWNKDDEPLSCFPLDRAFFSVIGPWRVRVLSFG